MYAIIFYKSKLQNKKKISVEIQKNSASWKIGDKLVTLLYG